MKLNRCLIIVAMLIASLFISAPVFATNSDEVNYDLSYKAYVQNQGWQDPVTPARTAGTVGQGLPIEAIMVESNLIPLNVQTHVQNVGWQEAVHSGGVSGTTEQALPIEAVMLSTDDGDIDLYYRVHSANFGWLGWAKNGEVAGTTGCAFPVEAIEIQAVPKGAAAPGDTNNACITIDDFHMNLRTHVQNKGWTEYVPCGVSGTVGEGLPVEAIDLSITDPTGKSGVVGQAYVSNVGWQNEAGVNDAIGTTGQGLPIEAFRYHLVGPAAQLFEVNYHAHAKNIGWLGWTAQNGTAGTANGALGVEAVEVNQPRKNGALIEPTSYKEIQIPCGIIPPGPTSIVINKATQTMAYYQNYDVTRLTNVVTGMVWADDTLAGDFTVMEKLPGYRTKGPGYDAVVRYWLTLYVGRITGFNGEGTIRDRVGIHDASWRGDWSRNAYKYNGSHGCVNTPLEPMTYIFKTVPVGAPVRIR